MEPMIPARARQRSAFTLIEMLVAVSVMLILMGMIFAMFNQASRAWLRGEQRADSLQNVRVAFDLLSRELEGAMVGVTTNPSTGNTNTMLQFLAFCGDNSGALAPTCLPDPATQPASLDASAISDQLFFIAPTGDNRMSSPTHVDLTEYGYFIAYCKDKSLPLGMAEQRYYLMRHQVRSTDTTNWDLLTNPFPRGGSYASSSPCPGSWSGNAPWHTTPAIGTSSTSTTPFLENVIRIQFQFLAMNTNTTASSYGPMLVRAWDTGSLGPKTLGPADPALYADTTLILPLAVQVTITVLDPKAAARLAAVYSASTPPGSIPSGDLANIPFNVSSVSNAAARNILNEGMRWFQRTIYLRNSTMGGP